MLLFSSLEDSKQLCRLLCGLLSPGPCLPSILMLYSTLCPLQMWPWEHCGFSRGHPAALAKLLFHPSTWGTGMSYPPSCWL